MRTSNEQRPVPVHAFWLVIGAVACTAVACTRSDADRERCANQHRLASNDVQVMSLDPLMPAPLVARAEGSCAGLSCLRTEPEAVVITQPDGALWAAWQGEKGRVIQSDEGVPVAVAAGEVPPHVAALADLTRARNAAAKGFLPQAASAANAPAVALAPEFRTCGTTNAGGGHAFHIIRNEDDTWQRLEWTRAPQSDDVKVLPPNAYPIVIGAAGKLCAYATQKTARHWQVHTPSGLVVDGAADREHPPAHCVSVDVVAIDTGKEAVRVARDGTVTKTPLVDDPYSAAGPITAEPTLPLFGQASSQQPMGTLRIADTTFARVLDGKDLAGKVLPAGAHRQRIASAGDGARFVVVTERIALPDCTTRELVHLIDTKTSSVTNVRDADVVIHKLGVGAGRFWWLESTPQIVDVGG